MDTTRKYPRTLEQAFGPYARGPIQEQYDPMPKADRIVVAGCIVAIVAIAILAVLGKLPGGAA